MQENIHKMSCAVRRQNGSAEIRTALFKIAAAKKEKTGNSRKIISTIPQSGSVVNIAQNCPDFKEKSNI